MSGQNDKISNLNHKKIEELIKQIKYHRDLYYNKQPEISDAKFDAIEDELRQLDPNNPVLHKIGVDSSELFNKKEHIIPMMSQDKVMTPADFKKWSKKRNINEFIVQYKLDGISIEFQYKNGVFDCALTRGDGIIGDDVSVNVMKMNGFLPRLTSNFTGAIRGEVLMFHDIYSKKYKDKQNCRNAAAGIVRRKDGLGNEDLNVIFYDAISMNDEIDYKKELEKVAWLKQENFPCVDAKMMKSQERVIKFRQEVMDVLRASLDFDIDGLVIKNNEIDMEDMKRAKPTKQVAFKFQAEEVETVLQDVEWSSKGHLYTPVAIVQKVKLMGTNVKRASLANPNLIKDLGLKIDATVTISKRGDIIPKIESILEIPPDARDIEIPQECEICRTHLLNVGTRLYCPNEECPKRYYRRLLKWIKTLDVKLFGEKLMLRDLYDTGRINEIADLYTLTKNDVKNYGVNTVKALNNLYSIKEISLSTLIGGFDIENIGKTLVQKLVDSGFDTLDKLKDARVSDLIMVEGFAEIAAENFVIGLKKRLPEIENLLNQKKISVLEPQQGGIFDGLTFCFTGKLNKLNRKQAESLVISKGGQTKSTVVNGLSYLVTNSTESTVKFEKARTQGVKIIDEEKFLKLVDGLLPTDPGIIMNQKKVSSK